MDDALRARQMASLDAGRDQSHACNCIGPRNGEPLCPCAMRGVVVRDGRYVLPERDLGPVAPSPSPLDRRGYQFPAGFKARFF